jgi:hypothetical protein
MKNQNTITALQEKISLLEAIAERRMQLTDDIINAIPCAGIRRNGSYRFPCLVPKSTHHHEGHKYKAPKWLEFIMRQYQEETKNVR